MRRLLAVVAVTLIGVTATSGHAPFPAQASTFGSLASTEVLTSARSEAPGVHQPCDAPLLDRPRRSDHLQVQRPNLVHRMLHQNPVLDHNAPGEQLRPDPDLWFDTCGKPFYVEPATDAHTEAYAGPHAVAAPVAAPAAVDVLALQSNPGASRTIYLDFTGDTITNTIWNSTYNQPTITAQPYSNSAPSDVNFTDSERADIYTAWQVVAEDYAPFDINVTTADLGVAAIERTSPSDTRYGTRVIITDNGTVGASCGCGGVAYVDTFSLTSGHSYYQPAWAFTAGVGTSGANVGQVVSHEAGHTLGLTHDGTANTSYYTGSGVWAPIMGASYGRRMSQWSAGEYPTANNTQDDLAVIAEHVPLRQDDHPDAGQQGDVLTENVAVSGVIERRTDTDSFTFTASGTTTVTVNPTTAYANLDIELTIQNASGVVLARIDPPVAQTGVVPSGLEAQWESTLPSHAATYTAVIDGVGSGVPSQEGQYSDYGSLGNYEVTLGSGTLPPPTIPPTIPPVTPPPIPPVTPVDPTTDNPPMPVNVADQTFTDFRAGQRASAKLTATGGSGPVWWSAVTKEPRGLTLNPDGTLSGKPTQPGTFTFTAQASSAHTTDTAVVTVRVAAADMKMSGPTTYTDQQNRRLRHVIRVSGGTRRYAWQVKGRLPAGVKVEASKDTSFLTIAGTPTRRGRYTIRVVVEDAAGTVSQRRCVLIIT